MSVSKEVMESLSNHEKTRQTAIFELIETEKEFVQDLEHTLKVIESNLVFCQAFTQGRYTTRISA